MRWIATFLLLTMPALATAQETFTLKLPPKSNGDTNSVTFEMQQTIGTLRLDTFGVELKDRNSRHGSKLMYVDEWLDLDKGEVTRYHRRFDCATENVNDVPPVTLAIHGKTLLVDRRQGAPQLTWEDGKPASDGMSGPLEDALKDGKEKLGAMASFEPLPNRPVKVGESWTIDVSAIVKDCEAKHGCKLTGATGLGTLQEVTQGAEGPCARVEVHIYVPLRTIKTTDKVLELNAGSGTTLDAVYDIALTSGDSTFASAMQMKFLATGSNPESDGTTTRVRIELEIDFKEQRSTRATATAAGSSR